MIDLDFDAIRETIAEILAEHPEARGLVMLVAFLHTCLGMELHDLDEWLRTHPRALEPGSRSAGHRFAQFASRTLEALEQKLIDEPAGRRELLDLLSRARGWLDLIEREVVGELDEV